MTAASAATIRAEPVYVRLELAGPALEGRQAAIERLLLHYRDLIEIGAPADHGDGCHVPLMPHAKDCAIHISNPPRCSCHQRSVAELERLLAIMRTYRRSQWWHVTERYIRAPILIRPMLVAYIGPRGQTLREKQPCRVLRPHPGIRNQKVRLGIKWLADAWSLPTEPMVAQESLTAAA